jgi:2-polyprenyl-3-methyl-5-hydroxy-6-metoxy-1,4-benzoquinol methylase
MLARFKNRAFEKEWLDDFTLSGKNLERNLINLELANRYLGGASTLLSAFKRVLQDFPSLQSQPLHIADLGCGSGDLLFFLAEWSNKKHFPWKFTGIDANPHIIQCSQKRLVKNPEVKFICQNIFSDEFQKSNFDIILLNAVIHHFKDQQLLELLNQLKKQTNRFILINDFHRHWLPYYAVRMLTHIGKCSYLEKHDAPLSIQKAFQKQELSNLLARAHLSNYQIHWHWPFRYQIIIKTN